MIQMFEWKYVFDFIPKLLPYIPVTLEVWTGSVIAGIAVGSIFAVIRIKNIPILKHIMRLIISIVRGIPPLTQLFIFYYGLPRILKTIGIDVSDIAGMWFVILAYGLNQGAAVAENFRSAFSTVGKGQEEAAYSIGMTGPMTFIRIMLPQALVVALPNFSNIFIASLKNTSLAFSVGVVEIMTRAGNLAASTQHRMESYVSLAIVYYILFLIVRKIFDILENKISFEKY